MRDFILNEKSELLLQHYRKGDWEKILTLYDQDNNEFYDERYLWIRPSEDDLRFIVMEAGSSQLISIGCGSGLLEWLISAATGVKVIGIEVDRNWWESPYAPPAFIPLNYSDEMSTIAGLGGKNESTAGLFNTTMGSKDTTDGSHNSSPHNSSTLMFCYFNNAPAFQDYVQNYGGDCVIIIGPGKGRGTHTDPEPFNAKFSKEWSMSAFQEIRTTKDFIAVYRR